MPRRPGRRAAAVGACLFLLLAGQQAEAQRGPPDEPEAWLDDPRRKGLTGELGRRARRLVAKGVTVRGHYIAEFAANPSGGLAQGAALAHQVDVGADIDLGKLVGLDGGGLHVTFTERTGYSLSQSFIGNIISVQEIYGSGQNVRLAGFAYTQSMLAGRLGRGSGGSMPPTISRRHRFIATSRTTVCAARSRRSSTAASRSSRPEAGEAG